ncbi:hypothetical protein WN990_31140 [Kitasatospora purpeofusca]|uniref:hypothetical protein n=1 Tax=Kitasatospora purpeofusca TaxID=67352 RepID=UPI0030F1637C
MATFGTDTNVGSTILALEEQLPAAEERLLRAQAELGAATTERDAVRQALEALRLLSGAPARTDEDRTPAADAPPVAVDAPPVAAEAVPDTEQAPSAPEAPVPAGPATAAAGAKKATPTRKAPARKAPARKTAEAAKEEPARTEPKRASARGAKTGGGATTAAQQEPDARTGRAARRRGPVGAEPPTAVSAAGRRSVTDADSILAVLSGSAEPLRAREVSEKLGLEPVQANVNAVRTRLERLAKDGRAQRPGRGLYTATARGTGSGA